jgi:hypothetical protein
MITIGSKIKSVVHICLLNLRLEILIWLCCTKCTFLPLIPSTFLHGAFPNNTFCHSLKCDDLSYFSFPNILSLFWNLSHFLLYDVFPKSLYLVTSSLCSEIIMIIHIAIYTVTFLTHGFYICGFDKMRVENIPKQIWVSALNIYRLFSFYYSLINTVPNLCCIYIGLHIRSDLGMI